MAVVELEQGVYAFLLSQLDSILAPLNTDLAAKVKSVGAPPAFSVIAGDVEASAVPCLSVSFNGSNPQRDGDRTKIVTLGFTIMAIITTAGDNTPSNFEMTRQVAHAHLFTLLNDDTLMQTPTIHAGAISSIQGISADAGPIVKLMNLELADQVTRARGLQASYNVAFSLNTR